MNSLVYILVKTAARVFLAPFFEFRVLGRENLPETGGFVLLPKHRRWEDIPLLALACPFPLYYVAKKELFLNPFSKWFVTSLGGIPLDRQRPIASRGSLRSIAKLLKRGERIVIFPEGTYYRNRMGPGHAGLIRLIHSHMEVPFIPVGIRYRGEGMRKQARITFGKALSWSSSVDPQEFLGLALDRIKTLSG